MYGVSTHSRPLGTSTEGAPIPPPPEPHDIIYNTDPLALVNAAIISGNRYQVTGGAAYANGGNSTEVAAEDCEVSYIVADFTGEKLWGLGTTGIGSSYPRINFAIDQSSNVFQVFELGVGKGSFGTVAVGNVIAVRRTDTVITYLKDTGSGLVVQYTSLTASTGALYCNVLGSSTGVIIPNITLTGFG